MLPHHPQATLEFAASRHRSRKQDPRLQKHRPALTGRPAAALNPGQVVNTAWQRRQGCALQGGNQRAVPAFRDQKHYPHAAFMEKQSSLLPDCSPTLASTALPTLQL